MNTIGRQTVLAFAMFWATTAHAESWSRRVQSAYPLAALIEGRQGTVHITVEVNEAGRADKCAITQSSGSKDLDDAACEQMIAYARFDPKRDEEGKPIRGTFSTRVTWKLP